MFSRFADQNAKLSDSSGVPFAQIKDQVREILSYQARKEDRIKKWLASAFLAAVRTGGREEFGLSFSWGFAGKTPSASRRTK